MDATPKLTIFFVEICRLLSNVSNCELSNLQRSLRFVFQISIWFVLKTIITVGTGSEDKRHQVPTTRVPQVRSCPPRGWSGVEVGIGMLRGGGDYQNSKILISQDVPELLKISKIPKMDSPRCTISRSERFANLIFQAIAAPKNPDLPGCWGLLQDVNIPITATCYA